MQRACDLLARREHSRRELYDKLQRHCEDEELLHDLIGTLDSEGLQSDERFVENFIHHRLNKGQGPLRIRQELSQRGIDDDLVNLQFESMEIDWLQIASAVREKKFGSNVPGDFQTRAKQSRFLYSRGFSSEQINQVLKSQSEE